MSEMSDEIRSERVWAEQFLFPKVHPSQYALWMEQRVSELATRLSQAALAAAQPKREASVAWIPPEVDDIAEAMADAGLWPGAWKGMCEAERNVTRQRAEGVHKMLLARTAAQPKREEGLRALVTKWRREARQHGDNGIVVGMESCAKELEAALAASPASGEGK